MYRGLFVLHIQEEAGDFFMLSPLTQCGGLAPDPSSALSYFEVPAAYPVTPANYANSISTPCNFVSDITLMAWTNAAVAGNTIDYKYSSYPSAGSGYAFRKSPSTVRQVSKPELQVFPQPGNEYADRR